MLRRPPRSTRTDTLFPTRRSSDLKFNGAARFTDDRTGSIWSWKLGLINQVTTGVELRATYSRDIRSPNLLELYSGQVLTLLNITDPQRNNDTYQIRSEEHTSELQSLMRISYAVFCLKKKKHKHT